GRENEQDKRNRGNQCADWNVKNSEWKCGCISTRSHSETTKIGLPCMLDCLLDAIGIGNREIPRHGQHDKCGHCADQDGINKCPHHRKTALCGGIIGSCHSMCYRS